ncbi:MAG: FKBP-type peptidyl-prolyl cis-trans isomerase [Haloarculaceae archaeon]
MGIEAGDRVRLSFVGRFEEGGAFATSRPAVAAEHGIGDGDGEGPSPLSFTVGTDEVIEGLDRAVRGMRPGETATVTVTPEQAYGERDPEKVREYDPETFEAMVGQPPAVGLHVEAGNGLHGDVTAVADTVQVDFNHELAGRTLVFELEVLAVE